MAEAVSDSSVLIHLGGIEQIELLQSLFESVIVPEAVWREVVVQNRSQTVVHAVETANRKGWLRRHSASTTPLLQHLRNNLHEGEAEAIGLAIEIRADTLLMDESDGRAVARSLGLKTLGILAVLLEAKRLGKIEAIGPLLDGLVQNHFYLSSLLIDKVLKEAGEQS